MQTIDKLTREYASNTNCLFIGNVDNLIEYKLFFTSIFRKVVFLKYSDVTDEMVKNNFDLVVLNISSIDEEPLSTHQQLKNFIRVFRKKNEILNIYALNHIWENKKVVELIRSCYCLDGIIPYPYSQDHLYKFLYRILKRVDIIKDLNSYIEILEGIDTPIENFKRLEPQISPKKNKIVLEDNRAKDLRFTQEHKISASDFMDSLDDSIIDKVENLSETLDTLIELIYDFEDATPEDALKQLSTINEIINEIQIIIDSIGAFDVTARAFGALYNFLNTLGIEQLSNVEQKTTFVAMLLSIIQDLEKWVRVIFIEQVSQDIHYFDASFASNIIEVENVFEVYDDDDDDEDLEFF